MKRRKAIKARVRAEQFAELRWSVGLPVEDVAELLQLTAQRSATGRKAPHRVSYAAFKLLRVLRA